MFTGIIGIGIGGLFYALSAVVMFFRELWKKFVRKNPHNRWQDAVWQLSIVVGSTLSLLLTGLLLDAVLNKFVRHPSATTTSTQGFTGSWLFSTPRVVQTLAVLFLVLAFIEVLNGIRNRKKIAF